jgi:hypothetical protein
MIELLLQFGPIPIGALFIYGGTQIEEKNGKNKGKTSLSKVLYVIGSLLIVVGVVYLGYLMKKTYD